METTPAPEVHQPVQGRERIAILDVLRGFALFGILTVNMYLFSRPLPEIYQGFGAEVRPYQDRVADWLVAFFSTGKFYTLFSLLFGLGFAIFLSRARAKGLPAVPLFVRRLLALLAFGLVHAYLIWIGDILATYALLGFVLLLFAWVKRPRTLLIWAWSIWGLSVLAVGLVAGALALAAAVPAVRSEIDAGLTAELGSIADDVARAQAIYSSGSFAEITAQRARELSEIYAFSAFTLPSILMMFLVGTYFGRRELFRSIDEQLPLFQRIFRWGLLIGIPANLIYASLGGGSTASVDGLVALMGASLAGTIGHPALSLAYMSGIVLLSRRAGWAQRLNLLAPVGQMALTNYLLQSIICTLIFYSYGLGLFGQLGTLAGLGVALLVYGLQIPLSHWWMARFRYGPAEWLWRTLTYLRPQPMRRAAPGAARSGLDGIETG